MSRYLRTRARRMAGTEDYTARPSPRPTGTEGWRVVAGMATHGPRIATADLPILSIARQVDVLHVVLNGERYVPDHLPRLPNVRYHADGSDLGARAKLYHLTDIDAEAAFGVDDDLLYPHDYVSHSLALLQTDPGSTYCYHGVRLNERYDTYRQSRAVWSGLRGLSGEPVRVHVLGTGTCFWSPHHALGGGPRWDDSPWPVRIDTPTGHRVWQRGGRVLCPPRRDPWIRAHRHADKACSIVRMTSEDPSDIDRYVLEHGVHRLLLEAL